MNKNNATSSLDIFVDRLEKKGYSVQEGRVEALGTPYLVRKNDDDKVIVLNPIWDGAKWKYEHNTGREFIYGESFIRMLPNMNGSNSYLDREVFEDY